MTEVLGIIDRGVGGLGLYQKIRSTSQRPILYFADNANQPYGLIHKTKLKSRLDDIIAFLKQQGATKILLACNSASVVYSDSNDVKGVIPFGVRALVNANAKKAGLIATLGTIKSEAYTHAFKQKNYDVQQQVAQPFAVYVEDGIIEGEDIENDAISIMRPLQHCDAILLACTHFPAIIPLLKRYIADNCQLIDPMDEMVSWINQHWPELDETPLAKSQFFVTGSKSKFIHSSKVSFNVSINPKNVFIVNQADLTH